VRIVLITQYYAPEPEPIPHELATGLVEKGHSVTVITGFPNYPYGKIFQGYKQKLWSKETVDGVSVIRFPLYPDRSRSISGRCLYYLSLAVSSTILGPLLCTGVDVVFIYHPITLAFPGFVIGLLRGAPFIVNIQDMYPESLSATNMGNNQFVTRIVGRFAKFVYDKAAAIAVISPGFKENLLRKGVTSSKIHVILNWANETIYRPVSPDEAQAKEYGMRGRFNIVYAGNMGPPQGLRTILEAASLLSDIPDLQFVLIGDGMERADLERMQRRQKIENVVFLPRQPASRMPSFYALADALLVHLADDPLFEITIPSKVQSYLAFGRPIIAAVKGDAASLVMEAGAGITAQPSSPAAVADAVRKLYSMPAEERRVMGGSGRRYFLEKLTMRVGIEKYEDLFNNVVSRRRANSRAEREFCEGKEA